jgi:hypothetical protein
MRGFVTKSILGATLAASTLVAVVPAEAQHYRGGYGYRGDYRHRGDSTGAAIAGGVVGLALGAAIASSANNDRYYYRDRPYYSYPRSSYYYDSYYAPPPPPCRIERRWDPYYDRPVNVRVCY